MSQVFPYYQNFTIIWQRIFKIDKLGLKLFPDNGAKNVCWRFLTLSLGSVFLATTPSNTYGCFYTLKE